MRMRFLAVPFAGAALALSLPAAAQFEHPDLKSRKRLVEKVLVLPALVQVTKSGVKGQEPLIEESRQVEMLLPGAVGKVLSDRGCTVLESPFTAQAFEKDPELKYALADLQGRFDALRVQLDQKSKDVRKGRFTLGDEVTKFNPGAAADALVFIRGTGVATTGGKKAMAVLFGVGSAVDLLEIRIAVVDAQSGAVLYFGKPRVIGNFRNPEKLTDSIQKSFKNFVGPVTPVKKTTG